MDFEPILSRTQIEGKNGILKISEIRAIAAPKKINWNKGTKYSLKEESILIPINTDSDIPEIDLAGSKAYYFKEMPIEKIDSAIKYLRI